MKAANLLLIDRLFSWPYATLRLLMSCLPAIKKKDNSHVIIIKLLGQGSLIRLYSFYRAQQVDERSFTLITFDINKEICALLGATNVRYLATTSVRHFFASLFQVVRFAREVNPAWVIDLERGSNAVGCFRFLLTLVSKSRCLGFDLRSALNCGRARTININSSSMEEIFETTSALLPVRGKGHSPATRKAADVTKVIVNINASDYVGGRRYPIRLFEKVILELHRTNPQLSFYLTGGKSEREYVQQLVSSLQNKIGRIFNKAGEWNWATFTDELESCSVFITGDSGPMHLAAHKQIPTVAIWGPTQAALFGYASPNVRNVSLNMACAPCFLHPQSQPYRACRGEITCMKNLHPDLIVREAVHLMRLHPVENSALSSSVSS